MNYDRRLQAYHRLRAYAWAAMRPVQALPLLHQSLSDVRRTDDLAIRSAAAQALGRLISAASSAATSAQQQGEHANVGQGKLSTLQSNLISLSYRCRCNGEIAVTYWPITRIITFPCRWLARGASCSGPGTHGALPAAQAHSASCQSSSPPGEQMPSLQISAA